MKGKRKIVLVYSRIVDYIAYRAFACDNGELLWAGGFKKTQDYMAGVKMIQEEIINAGYDLIATYNNN